MMLLWLVRRCTYGNPLDPVSTENNKKEYAGFVMIASVTQNACRSLTINLGWGDTFIVKRCF